MAMDIYEFAMKMEKDGENYYRELAKMTVNTGLRNIFTMLANAEVVHHKIFKKMKENEKVEAAVTRIMPEVKNIFEKMREEEKDPDIHITQTDSYKKAQEIEKESMDFYLSNANAVDGPHQKEIFIRIAGEEKKHYFILEEIVNFVSRPETWLENPEWYHLEEY
jgi:rubrerythrin